MNVWLTIATTGTGLVFVAIAIPLIRRRIPPNRLYGLRVPATFVDEWYGTRPMHVQGATFSALEFF